MSYRLIDANALAANCKEVNDMPCIYADLPNGLDDGYYDLARAKRTCRNIDDEFPFFICSECGCNAVVGYRSSGDGLPNYCPNCGRKVVDA